ncbi:MULTISPECIES: hypothetical protein [Pseudomonas]|jgi:hypothetical protein|uniref:hypothetical protein n=1 Tax=Pseudomonas TaxID=286 RepID=UPI00068D1278|nr:MULTISPECIES: hypothetical protein [Pseudomonas]
MNITIFNEVIKPKLTAYSFEYSAFTKGDFGDLERVELEGRDKVATIDFWSQGWIGIDVYDCAIEEQILNSLTSPEEQELAETNFTTLVELLTKE